MEDQRTKLTEEDINELIETLSDNENEDISMIRNLPSNQGVETNNDNASVIKMEANMHVNPNTGEISPVNMNEEKPNADIAVTDIEGEHSIDKIEITSDMIANNSTLGDLSEEDAKELLNLIMRYQKGEKFSVYNNMPHSMKVMAGNLALQTGSNKNSMAKFILEQFINDIQLDQAFIEFNDTIQKELKLFNITDIYSEHRKEIMEDKMLETANNIEAEYPEKAKMLRDISAMFTETYKMEIIENGLSNRKNRQFIKNTDNYEKVCRDFNIKYEKSKFKINNVAMLAPILSRRFKDKYDTEDIMRFVMLFCMECRLKDPSDILDHTFMYYTIQNILMLDYVNTDEDNSNGLTIQLLNNISRVIDKIRELY